MQVFNIYCDESRYTNPFEQYFVIGSLIIPREQKKLVQERIYRARAKYGFNTELGWNNVTETKLPYLNELLQIFFTSPLEFRCIILDKAKLKLSFKSSESELAFYKFYYLLLKGVFKPAQGYYLFLDQRTKSEKRRIGDLQRYLIQNLEVVNHNQPDLDFPLKIQEVNSSESILIQLADLLMGAVGYYWNGFRGSAAKLKLVNNISSRLQKENLKFSSQLYDKKWNQFVLHPEEKEAQFRLLQAGTQPQKVATSKH